MASYWVRVGGNDGNAGTSYALAKATIPAGLALLSTKGDILNIVNDATHTWPVSAQETNLTTGVGTSWVDYGFLIRGVADTGDDTITPEFATLAPGTTGIHRMMRASAGSGYIIVRNLIFDATPNETSASNHIVVRVNSPTGPVWIDGCALLVLGTGSINTAGTRQFVGDTTSVDGNKVTDCYIQNPRGTFYAPTGAGFATTIQGNVCYNDDVNAGPTLISRTNSGVGDTIEFIGNTVYRTIGNNASSPPVSYSVGGTDGGTVNVYDNIFFCESSSASPDVEFLDDPSLGSVTWAGTVGYNALLGGPNVGAGDLSASGWYSGTFDQSEDPKLTDEEAFSQVEATIFSDPTATYSWDPLGNGATITILKDLRPLVYLTSSQSGGVLGALPAAQTDYTVTIAADKLYPQINETVVVTVTIANSGVDATSVAVTMAIPSGCTYVSDTPSAGTYDDVTGVWTVGALDDAASETLAVTMTVDSDQAGNTITVTATQTAGDPSTDPVTSDNTDSLTLTVADDTDPIGDTGSIPFIDVLPIFAPVLKMTINSGFSTSINRVRDAYERYDLENERYIEFSAKRLILATNTTTQISMGGIQRAQHLMIQATTNIQVSVANQSTVFYPVCTFIMLGRGDFETLYLKNTSTTATSTVDLVVTD